MSCNNVLPAPSDDCNHPSVVCNCAGVRSLNPLQVCPTSVWLPVRLAPVYFGINFCPFVELELVCPREWWRTVLVVTDILSSLFSFFFLPLVFSYSVVVFVYLHFNNFVFIVLVFSLLPLLLRSLKN